MLSERSNEDNKIEEKVDLSKNTILSNPYCNFSLIKTLNLEDIKSNEPINSSNTSTKIPKKLNEIRSSDFWNEQDSKFYRQTAYNDSNVSNIVNSKTIPKNEIKFNLRSRGANNSINTNKNQAISYQPAKLWLDSQKANYVDSSANVFLTESGKQLDLSSVKSKTFKGYKTPIMTKGSKLSSISQPEEIELANQLTKIEGLSIKKRMNDRKIIQLKQKDMYKQMLKRNSAKTVQMTDFDQDPKIKRLQKEIEKTMRRIEDSCKRVQSN